MELARAAAGLDATAYRLDARLSEISFGRWEGFTISELRQRWPDAVEERERDKWGFVAAGSRKLRHDVGSRSRLV